VKLTPNLDTNLSNMRKQEAALADVIKTAQASHRVLVEAIKARVASQAKTSERAARIKKYPPYCVTVASRQAYDRQLAHGLKLAKKRPV
jgi:hypothetical protein